MMKNFKRTIVSLLAMVCVMSFAISCGEENGDDIATEIVGTYSGTIAVKTGGVTIDSVANSTITVSKVNENTVKLALSAFTIQSIPVTGISTDAAVEKTSTGYSLAGNVNQAILTFSITGPFEGTIEKDDLNASFDLVVALGTSSTINIDVTFE